MQVTRIRARSLPEALAEARKRLGPDAVVLSQSREADQVELLVAIDRNPKSSRGLARLFRRNREQASPAAQIVAELQDGDAGSPSEPSPEPRSVQPTERRAIDDTPAEPPSLADNARDDDLVDQTQAAVRRVLLRSGLGRELTERFGDVAFRDERATQSPGELARACEGAFRDFVPLEPCRNLPKFLFLFGPPGAGKTSSALRLVAREMESHPTVLAQIEDGRELWRVDLTDTCNEYGIPYVRVRSLDEMNRLVDASEGVRVVFDTGGLVRADPERWETLIEYRETVPTAEAIGVIPSGFPEHESKPFLNCLRQLSPTAIALTRLDEGGSIGHLLRECSERELPIAFTSHGRGLSRSWQPASYRNLAAAALRPLARELSA